ncbi:outer membrane protein assembly factor BamE [Chromatium okenii]|uniref:outer membrane protein assembly factor BamE n=1 Tax=Chromatium okenii TaxID=61644 RepID=UPI0026EADD00|nr:outer membrane protein assembly factor BamE [Chromatium okenii]MBV5309861.1 outer membrane protein assembly factor BamE [Chromatium okenii]
MQQIFRLLVTGALVIFFSTGCAQEQKPADYQGSVLESLPFVYKMTVQQGNILTEEMVDSLTLGMNKRQVNFLLGTPLLTDFFHQDRWDYAYSIQRGHQAPEKHSLTLYFKDDALVRIEGDLKPNAQRAAAHANEVKDSVVTVPDYQAQQGLITRGLKAIGLEPKQ